MKVPSQYEYERLLSASTLECVIVPSGMEAPSLNFFRDAVDVSNGINDPIYVELKVFDESGGHIKNPTRNDEAFRTVSILHFCDLKQIDALLVYIQFHQSSEP
jgi:hypothetical protein